MELIVAIVFILLLFGSLPVFPYSSGWGYRGTGIITLILVVIVLMWLMGYGHGPHRTW